MADMITLEFTSDELTILFNVLTRQSYLLGDAALVAPVVNKINAKRPAPPVTEGEVVKETNGQHQ